MSSRILNPTGYVSTVPKAILDCGASFLLFASAAAAIDAADVGVLVAIRLVIVVTVVAVVAVGRFEATGAIAVVAWGRFEPTGALEAPRPNGGSGEDRRFRLVGGAMVDGCGCVGSKVATKNKKCKSFRAQTKNGRKSLRNLTIIRIVVWSSPTMYGVLQGST